MSIQKAVHNFPIELESAILSSTPEELELNEKLPVKRIYVDPNNGKLTIEFDDGE